jgi:hypothetical protein
MDDEIKIAGVYKLGRLIGKGSFGMIFAGLNMQKYPPEPVAIKFVLSDILNVHVGISENKASTVRV